MAFDIKDEVRKTVAALPDGAVVTLSSLYDKMIHVRPKGTEQMTARALRMFIQSGLDDLRIEEMIALQHGELHRGDAVYRKGKMVVSTQVAQPASPAGPSAVSPERKHPEDYVCVNCGGPRSYGSDQRCKKCCDAKVASKTIKTDPRQGPTYKPLDLVEVEEAMATESTMAEAAKKLGMTTSQMSVRRQKDQAVSDAVDRDRARYYQNMPDEDEGEEKAAEESTVNRFLPSSNGHSALSDTAKLIPLSEAASMLSLDVSTIRKGLAGTEGLRLVHQGKKIFLNEGDVILYRDNLIQNGASVKPAESLPAQLSTTAETYSGVRLHQVIQVCASEIAQWPRGEILALIGELSQIANVPQKPIRTVVKRAWSVEFENDDSEDGVTGLTMLYLVSLLHDGMEEHEKQAVWTLIQYIKRMQLAVEQMKSTRT